MTKEKKGKRTNLIIWEKENNYKGYEVAQKLGISKVAYSYIKNGKTTPSIEFVYKFTEVYPDADVLKLMKIE